MASVLLTGGTGTLGRAVEPALLERGHTVRILSRREQPAGREPGTWARGDLQTGDGIDAAVEIFERFGGWRTTSPWPGQDYEWYSRLASNGVRFKQFYNNTRCCPSRAALVTGVYPHQAGVGARQVLEI